MKEALSIRTTPEDARFNRDNGYELPDCWIATFKKWKGGASLSSAHRRHAHAVVWGARPGMRTLTRATSLPDVLSLGSLYKAESLQSSFISPWGLIRASNRNVGKISFLWSSCLQREPSSLHDYREISKFTPTQVQCLKQQLYEVMTFCHYHCH